MVPTPAAVAAEPQPEPAPLLPPPELEHSMADTELEELRAYLDHLNLDRAVSGQDAQSWAILIANEIDIGALALCKDSDLAVRSALFSVFTFYSTHTPYLRLPADTRPRFFDCRRKWASPRTRASHCCSPGPMPGAREGAQAMLQAHRLLPQPHQHRRDRQLRQELLEISGVWSPSPSRSHGPAPTRSATSDIRSTQTTCRRRRQPRQPSRSPSPSHR